jgi:poly [ADP-ribose] polymerase 2/3/4
MATGTASAPTVTESKLYIAVDPLNNNNKYWKYERYSAPITEGGETGDLKITWGRVGADNPESQLRMYDEKFLAGKIREKLKGKLDKATGRRVPYTEAQVMDGFSGGNTASAGASPKALTSAAVSRVAVEEIAGDNKVLGSLVKKLAEVNRHELLAASGGQMDIDLATGMVRTPLGVVTSDAVTRARVLLDDMAPFVKKHDTNNKKFVADLEQYLRLIPQKLPGKKGWHETFIVTAAQSQLLDQLEASVELAEQRMKDAAKAAASGKGDAVKIPSVFDVKMSMVEDGTIISKIKRMFEQTMSSRHEAGRLKPVRTFEIEIGHMAQAFRADGSKIGNVKLLWHGTRMFNVLSILKRGFVLPSQLSSVQTTGAMYGSGLYFSAMSTKSLNYSYGYWDGGRRDANCYMFLVDVAMGKEYIPSYSGNGKKPGYDSCWAKPGTSGVINDEQIVYRTSQANIRYLVEFDEK